MSPDRRRLVLIALGLLVPFHPTVSADLLLSGRTGGTSMGMTIEGELVTRIKGLKLRSDVVIRGETMSTIVDLGSGTFMTLRPTLRQAEVYDMKMAAAGMAALNDAGVATKLTPTGRKEVRQGLSCEEYTVELNVNVAPPPNQPLTLTMRGPVWIAPSAPGRADFARFYAAAADRRLFFNDPRSAIADPPRTRALTLLFKQIAQLGVLVESSIEVSFDGQGAMAGAAQRMGVSTMINKVTRTSADPIADDVFVVPSDYTITNK